MDERSTPRTSNWLGRTLSAAAFTLVCGGAAAVFAQSPQSIVADAQDEAQRHAAVEASLSELEANRPSEHVQFEARDAAAVILTAARAFRPVELPSVPKDWQKAGLDLSKAVEVDGKLVQTLSDGSKVTFTVDPDTQKYVEKMLDDYNVPHSGVVLIDPPTGRVRAFVSHNEYTPAVEDIARKSMAPSASVFKIVSAAAFIESAGINPYNKVCYHGGRSHLTASNIKGDKRRDRKCANLGAALAWSINSIIAKLAYRNLKKDDLETWAERFGYNTEIPFELPVEVSTAEMVDNKLERARSAAGFWHTYLSPLHGALIGASLANDGVMMAPSIVEKYETADGEVIHAFKPRVFRRVMTPQTAKILSDLMVTTTTKGTARKYFRNRKGFPNDITVSGKTGTLSNKNPYLGFTWFVGFADHKGASDAAPSKVAVAGLVCNTPTWRIKGAYAASEAVRKFFESVESKAKKEPVATR